MAQVQKGEMCEDADVYDCTTDEEYENGYEESDS